MVVLDHIHGEERTSVCASDLRALLAAMDAGRGVSGDADSTNRLKRMSGKAIRWRNAQRRIFPGAALRDSCWDILLLCLDSELAGRQMCVKQLRAVLEESQTSVLRRIDELEATGLLCRLRDELDGRRTLVRLTPIGADAMSRFSALVEE